MTNENEKNLIHVSLREDTVSVPREEYEELVSEVTILRVAEALVREYHYERILPDLLGTIFSLGEEVDLSALHLDNPMEDDGK